MQSLYLYPAPIAPGWKFAFSAGVKRSNYIQLTIWLTFLLAIAPISTRAQNTEHHDLRINDDLGSAQQTAPRIATQANGTSVVTWLDRRNGLHDIYTQRLNSLWFRESKNSALTGDSITAERFEVSLAASVSGKYVACWKDFRNGAFPFGADIYQTTMDSTGLPGGEEMAITASQDDSLFEAPDVALHTDGSGVTVWAQHHNNNWDILGQRFDQNGAPAGNPFTINDDFAGAQQHAPRVSVSTLGWFVVSWYDNRRGNDDVFFQLYDASGAAIGGNIRASDDNGATRQAFPAVACDGSGHFTICWVDWRNGAYPQNPDIYIRRFSSVGDALTEAQIVTRDEFGAPQKEPALATDRLGNVMVVWADSSFGGWDIYGRLINHRGDFVDSAFLINSDTLGRQVQPDVSMDGFDARVVWSDMRNGDFDIYGKLINYNDPALSVEPSELDLSMRATGPAPDSVVVAVLNAGLGALIYEVVDTISWLSVNKVGGVAPDSVIIRFDKDTMPVGTYYAELQFINHTNLDSAHALLLNLTVTPAPNVQPKDTLKFSHVLAQPGNKLELELGLISVDRPQGIHLAMNLDTVFLTFDSISVSDTLNNTHDASATYDPLTGSLTVDYSPINPPADGLVVGSYETLKLHLRAADYQFAFSTEHLFHSPDSAQFDYAGGSFGVAPFIHGMITVGLTTATGESPGDPALPRTLIVGQNYPNPFNAEMRFQVDFPRSGEARVRIFNVLGQRVRTLFSGKVSAGVRVFGWDGAFDSGIGAPSGLYIYQVEANDQTIARKALLLK